MKWVLAGLLAAMLAAPAGSRGEPAAEARPARTERQVLDRIVAVLDKQPLLLSELELEARVAFIRQGAAEAGLLELSEADLAGTLEYVVGQRLAFDEAERLQVFEVSDEDVVGALADFTGRFAHQRAYEDWLFRQEASEDQLAAILRRDLRVSRFLESKVKLAARVSEEQMREFYRAHAEDFVGQPYAQVREAIKTHLTRERYRTLTRRQLDELRRRSDVRILAPFARAQPAPPDAAAAGTPP